MSVSSQGGVAHREREREQLLRRACLPALYRSTEDFSYFTLLRPARASKPATSLFGISCTRQMDASTLLNRPADVTRSTVQKAVVIIADSPQHFGTLRERLGVVTSAWFAQKDFGDTEILRRFQSHGRRSGGVAGDEFEGINQRVQVADFGAVQVLSVTAEGVSSATFGSVLELVL